MLKLEDPVYVTRAALASYPSQLRHYVGVAGHVIHVSAEGVVDVNWPVLGCSSTFRLDELSNAQEASPATVPRMPRYVD